MVGIFKQGKKRYWSVYRILGHSYILEARSCRLQVIYGAHLSVFKPISARNCNCNPKGNRLAGQSGCISVITLSECTDMLSTVKSLAMFFLLSGIMLNT